MYTHKEQCNFHSGEACVCRWGSKWAMGWENVLRGPLGPTPAPRSVELPEVNDNAIRVHIGVYYRLGEGQ